MDADERVTLASTLYLRSFNFFVREYQRPIASLSAPVTEVSLVSNESLCEMTRVGWRSTERWDNERTTCERLPKDSLASAAVVVLCGTAQAADLPVYSPVYTKAAPAASPTPSCTSAEQFIATDCPLSYYGITVYGTVDIGGGYETHGTPFNSNIITGVEETRAEEQQSSAVAPHAQWPFSIEHWHQGQRSHHTWIEFHL